MGFLKGFLWGDARCSFVFVFFKDVNVCFVVFLFFLNGCSFLNNRCKCACGVLFMVLGSIVVLIVAFH